MDKKRMGAAPGAEELSAKRLLRLKDIIAPGGPLPISRSAFLAAVADGRFPKPFKLGPRTSCWRQDSIIALIDDLSNDGEA